MSLREDSVEVESIGTEVAFEALHCLLSDYDFDTLLDVGSGRGEHARAFRFMGRDVTTLDPVFDADIKEDFLTADLPQFDVVWCSHVLEHQRDIGRFIDKMITCCKPNGLICISVPPEINPHFLLCHPNQFSVGLLLYHLILAGVDCRNVRALTYGYNVSVIVPNVKNGLPRQSWAHEMECAEFFPTEITRHNNQLFGPLRSLNWESKLKIEPHMNSHLS